MSSSRPDGSLSRREFLRGAGAGLVAAAGLSLGGGVAQAAPSSSEVDAVTKGLMCQCGCGLTVAACELAMTCEVAARIKGEAKEKLAKGMTVKQALASFAADYGERILAAPTKHGFNLVAWITPFAGLGAGAVLVAVALRQWRTHRPVAVEALPAIDETTLARIDDEVRRGM